MSDDWVRPRASEDFGDAFVVGGCLGLMLGTALGNPSFGVICGLIVGAITDGLIAGKLVRVGASR